MKYSGSPAEIATLIGASVLSDGITAKYLDQLRYVCRRDRKAVIMQDKSGVRARQSVLVELPYKHTTQELVESTNTEGMLIHLSKRAHNAKRKIKE